VFKSPRSEVSCASLRASLHVPSPTSDFASTWGRVSERRGCVLKAHVSRDLSRPHSHVSRYRSRGRLHGAISSLVFEKGYLHKHPSTITRLPSSKQLLSGDMRLSLSLSLSLFLSVSLFFRKLPFTLRVNIYAERITLEIDFIYSLYLTPLTRVPC